MIDPRGLAVRVLTRVLSDQHPLDDALVSVAGEIAPESVGWLYEVCSGTLRWKGRLDGILDSISVRKKPSGWLRKILLLAVYQLVVQDRTSAARIVSETVSEVRNKEGDAPASFANACLRKVSAQALAWRNQPFPASADPQSDPAAAWASLPLWMWKKLLKQHGLEWCRAYAEACLQRPQLWLRSKSPAWTLDWAKPGPVANSWLVESGGGQVTRMPGFAEGEWIVQDVSSQSLIHEITKVLKQTYGENPIDALDLCAAPGGKSVGLSWNGIQVAATDIREDRVQLLQDTIRRANAEIRYCNWNEVVAEQQKELVWVDAPCSGSGIIRRHPDVRWLRQEKELSALIQEQKKILLQGWDKVLPGGYLAYSVCSVFEEEGPGVIKAAKAAGLQGELVQHWFLGPQNAPYGDGFWCGLLRKPA